jgi:membrane protein DedA with SNARE-associated domain
MSEETILQFVGHYGYIGIFSVLMFGIIGLPVPDEVLMTFTGYLVSLGKLHFMYTVLVASLGSITGMSISFFVGQKLGLPFLQKYGRRVHITEERLNKMDRWFVRFGKYAVTIGYFIPGVRHTTALFAGISKWSYASFLLYAIPGALAWALTFVTTGMVVGHHWKQFSHLLHRYLVVAFAILLVGAFVWWWFRKRGGRKSY